MLSIWFGIVVNFAKIHMSIHNVKAPISDRKFQVEELAGRPPYNR